jgi:hypothetical protein
MISYLQFKIKATIKSMEMVVNDVKTAKAVNQKNSLLSMTLIFFQINEFYFNNKIK